MKLADLHIHTNYSDSSLTPQEVVEEASRCGLACIGITDHDTIEGIQPTIEIAQEYDLEVLAGIELSSEIQGKDVHILGYLFDYENEHIKEQFTFMQNVRVERMKKMIEKLKGLGIDGIGLEEVCSLSKSKSVGRPHLATILMQKGKVSSLKEAFDKYLAEGAPAYVPKFKQTPFEAIQLIEKAGGIAVLAHPMITLVDELIPSFVKAGLKGLEVYYPNVSTNVVDFYKELANKYHLVLTGGSDAHGQAKKNTFIGKVKVSYECVEKLKETASLAS